MEVIRQIPRAEIIAILTERDGFLCFLCKNEFEKDQEVTLDHWIPQARGGTWATENLRLAHKRCNALKGDRMPNPDGSLPALKREVSLANRRLRRSVRSDICTTCQSGRSLGPDEYCDACGSVPMPFRHPQWAKLSPNDCDHEGVWWCWCCMSGIIDRKPAIYDVLNSDDDSEFAA